MPKIRAATVPEHRERSHEALLDAVVELVAERGFDAMTMGDIAARAGMTRTAVYNYATDKTALLVSAVERQSRAMRARAAAIAADRSRSAAARVDALVQLIALDAEGASGLVILKAVHTSLTASQRDLTLASFREDITTYFAALLEEGVAAGDYPAVPDPTLTIRLTTGVLDAAVLEAVARPADAGTIAATAARFIRAAWTDQSPLRH